MNRLIRFCAIAGLIFLLSGLAISSIASAAGGISWSRLRPHHMEWVLDRLDDFI